MDQFMGHGHGHMPEVEPTIIACPTKGVPRPRG
jgi:hypothetical protein